MGDFQTRLFWTVLFDPLCEQKCGYILFGNRIPLGNHRIDSKGYESFRVEWNKTYLLQFREMEALVIFILPSDHVVVNQTTFDPLTAPKFFQL